MATADVKVTFGVPPNGPEASLISLEALIKKDQVLPLPYRSKNITQTCQSYLKNIACQL